jgi:G3E family GTPase
LIYSFSWITLYARRVRPSIERRQEDCDATLQIGAHSARRSRGVTDAGADRVPVVLVTGFLGSGKTTLVNRLLKSHHYARAAVVVNEFGEVSVDHLLVDAPRHRTRIIDGGCVCGHVHEEVATSLLDLLDHRASHAEAQFDRVLIETSGLADPVPIIQILLADVAVSAAFELRTVVTVCDGVHGVAQLGAHEESMKQAAVADVLVLSKRDLAGDDALAALSQRLASLNPGARQCAATHGELDLSLLDAGGYAIDARSADAKAWLSDPRYATATPAASQDPSIRTFSLTHDGEITVPGLVLWMNLLAGFRGAGLLRVKGILNVEGRPYAVHAVQSVLSEPAALAQWPDGDDRRSRLVFITRGIAPDEVKRTFATLAFEGGRAQRNLTIRPETYARFKQTMEVFRAGARQASKAPASRERASERAAASRVIPNT